MYLSTGGSNYVLVGYSKEEKEGVVDPDCLADLEAIQRVRFNGEDSDILCIFYKIKAEAWSWSAGGIMPCRWLSTLARRVGCAFSKTCISNISFLSMQQEAEILFFLQK